MLAEVESERSRSCEERVYRHSAYDVDGLTYALDGAPSTVFELLAQSAARHAPNPCLGSRVAEEPRYDWATYGDLGALAYQVALGLEYLATRHAPATVRLRRPVAILGPNCKDYMNAIVSVAASGLPIAPIGDTDPEVVCDALKAIEVDVVFCHVASLETLVPSVCSGRSTNLTFPAKVLVVFDGGRGCSGGAATDETARNKVWDALMSKILASPTPEQTKRVNDCLNSIGVITTMRSMGDLAIPRLCDPPPWGAAGGRHSSPQREPRGREGEDAAAPEPSHEDTAAAAPPGRGGLGMPAPHPEDTFAIMFTSGTSGKPKGVSLSHSAVVSTVASLLECSRSATDAMEPFNKDDVYLSFLPLSHIFGMVTELLMLHVGASIGYWSGSPRLLIEDAQALRPTYIATVPRVLERIRDGIRRFSFSAPIVDHLVVCGGAPLQKGLQEDLELILSCPIIQGYGLTETCGASFVAPPKAAAMLGTVGPPLPMVCFKLLAAPELDYDPMADPPRGEVAIKGPGLFSEYLGDPDLTAAAMTPDGFFITGDIGEITSEGALKIIDRRKSIFKLSQGEYIQPERLEQVYRASKLVSQIFVTGDSFRSCLVAVVVPDRENLLAKMRPEKVLYMKKEVSEAAEESQEDEENAVWERICRTDKARDFVLSSLTTAARAHGLKGYERIKSVHLEPLPSGLDTTATMKLKRNLIARRYRAEVDGMYAALGESPSPARLRPGSMSAAASHVSACVTPAPTSAPTSAGAS